MEKEFFEKKIRVLSDDKLQSLMGLQYEANREIIDIAIDEAKNRGIAFPEVFAPAGNAMSDAEDKRKLDKWNWGAFLLAPFWTLANRLEKWALLTFIPGVNVVVIIYLGLNGNRLAYDKSYVKNVDHFMTVQGQWNKWGIRVFYVGIAFSIFAMLF